ncbi:sensor histidine kinase [Dyadobacter pollutisoli]|uniref:Histidine kinase n=1 Tax=Dyadobacter pollutisoli TaxID=2910158 RepID=A0A9E8SNP0_9BACT|nr:sensor histidine kinase [Dyadobacter pollutisoli]WAC14579.1 histidine kinase [Dyadobacter pollutisoli]
MKLILKTPHALNLMKPDFFSKYEWRYHLAMMPVIFAAGNYYFIGPDYFTNAGSFLIGTGLIFVLYWSSVVVLTIAIRRIISWYPSVDQTPGRIRAMFWLIGSLTLLLTMICVGLYSSIPGTTVTFTWAWLWPAIIFCEFANFPLCALLGLIYTLDQWKKNQAESEKLERIASEQQFNLLKGQVNPHFLFNSLNTLSSLIGEDPERAEHFVEDLAKIYRYMLQAAKTDLVSLNAELGFLQTYIRLLQVRHGENLQVMQPAHHPADIYVPPLVLQIMVDHAVKHNIMSANKTLTIHIEVLDLQNLRVRNNIQSKIRTIGTDKVGLAALNSKYLALSSRQVLVEETATDFTVILPLLSDRVPVSQVIE